MSDFVMPSLGADMDAGTLVKWHVQVGDTVRRGDIVADVETAKGVIEVEVFEAGAIEEILVEPGAKVPVGTVLARLGSPGVGESVAEPGARPPGPPQAAPPVAPAVPVATPVRPAVAPVATPGRPARPAATPAVAPARPAVGPALTSTSGAAPRGEPSAAALPAPMPSAPAPAGGDQPEARRIKASPLARRLAAELGLDLAGITGSGPGGAIDRADVERAAAAPERVGAVMPSAPSAEPSAAAPSAGLPPAAPTAPPAGPQTAPPPATTTALATAPEAAGSPANQLRQAIAAAMARSNREIPHYFLQTSIDMQRALAWMREGNSRRSVGDRLLVAALLVKAVAKAAAVVPELNGYWTNDRLDLRAAVHVGLAVALRHGGLIAPALHDVGTKSLDEVMRAMGDLIGRARTGRLRSSEMSDGAAGWAGGAPTITVTNLGDLGVESVFGVIYPPQVALVGFGRISERPWAVDGLLGVRPILTATLAADHRATDGRQGARFLDAIAAALASPETL